MPNFPTGSIWYPARSTLRRRASRSASMPSCKAPIRKPPQTKGLSGRYYLQSNPTNNPFGAVGSLLGFAQQLTAGSQVFSLANSVVLSPNLTWEQHLGFTRLRAYANTTKGFPPSSVGITLPGSATFPQFDITKADPTIEAALEFGPSTSFGDGGMFQNQWEFGTSMSWVKGKHILSVGTTWDHTQLNIINNNTK